MDIVIAGAGEVGTHLANMLSKQEHNIMLIDSDEEKLELLGNQLDVMSIVGSCTSIWCIIFIHIIQLVYIRHIF